MPNLNGSGPEGIGPGTGRGMGRCGSGQAGVLTRRGMRGAGRFNPFCRFRPSFSEEEKKNILDEEERALENRLKQIREEKSSI